jgi:lipid A 4'-phosphatase
VPFFFHKSARRYSPRPVCHRDAVKKPLLCILITSLLSYIFVNYPQTDLFFSQKFYSATTGTFPYLDSAIFTVINRSAYFIAAAFFFLHIKFLFVKPLPKNNKRHKHDLLLFLLGPVLTVQIFCKKLFGRARPESIVEFGGTQEFSPAFMISGECSFNCSFVSFHAALATVLFLYQRNFSKGYKKSAYSIVTLSLITLYSTIKLVQGRHFLSDIIFSICFIFILDTLISLKLRGNAHSVNIRSL